MRETEEDRKNQLAVQEAIQRWHPDWEIEQTRVLDPYDMDVYIDQKKIALIEARRRNCSHGKYPDYWMSYNKYKQLRLLGEAFEVPMYFVITFDDGYYILDLMKYPNLPTTYGNRGNPDQPRLTDNEKVVEIAQEYFKRAKFNS